MKNILISEMNLRFIFGIITSSLILNSAYFHIYIVIFFYSYYLHVMFMIFSLIYLLVQEVVLKDTPNEVKDPDGGCAC